DVAGVTDFIVEKTIQAHPLLAGKQTITLDREVRLDKKEPNLLLFADLDKQGKLDFYRGVPVRPNSALPRYVEGILEHRHEKPAQRLRFYFDYLNHAEDLIANDALQEF